MYFQVFGNLTKNIKKRVKEKIRCGLCSFGMSGRIFHAPLISAHPGFILHAVLERKSNNAAEKYPKIKTYRTFSELLDDPEIDLIIVNVPDHLHASFTKETLKAGKHAVIEKPFTLAVEEGKELIKLAETLNLSLFVFQNRRWDSDFLSVQKIISSNKLGQIVEYEAHYDRYRPKPPVDTWKEDAILGPGLLYNLGAHLIDQALVLFGWPEAVYADLDTIRENSRIIDYFNIILYYPKLRVILRSSYLVRQPIAKYIIHGVKGSFIKSGSDPQEENLNKGWLANHVDLGKEKEKDWGRIYIKEDYPDGEIVESQQGNYLKFYDGVFEDLSGKKNVAVSGEEGLNVVKIIEAAFKSSEELKTVRL